MSILRFWEKRRLNTTINNLLTFDVTLTSPVILGPANNTDIMGIKVVCNARYEQNNPDSIVLGLIYIVMSRGAAVVLEISLRYYDPY